MDISKKNFIPRANSAFGKTFGYLGLTDLAVISLAERRKALVLTDDLDLQRALAVRGLESLNINHLRNVSD
jgi:hypothetical protein